MARKTVTRSVTARERWLRDQYQITEVQWERMFRRQDGKCPICLKPILRPGNKEGKRAPAVDHDHYTGRVRGLLHWKCNRYYVGRMTAELSRRVTAYLESTFDGRDL